MKEYDIKISNNLLEKYKLHLERLYLIGASAKSKLINQTSGIFSVAGLLLLINHGSIMYVSTIIAGYGIYFIYKNNSLLSLSERHIRKLENNIYNKTKLIYCNCSRGAPHFYSPRNKKIWSTKHNIFYDYHDKERQNIAWAPKIFSPYLKDDKAPCIIRKIKT